MTFTNNMLSIIDRANHSGLYRKKGLQMSGMIEMLTEGLTSIRAEELVRFCTEKIGEDEVAIGEITSDEMRRFCVFIVKYRENMLQEMRKRIEETKEMEEDVEHNPETCPHCLLAVELETEMRLCEAFKNLLWSMIRKGLTPNVRLKEEGGRGIGIREGWKLVILPKEKDKLLSDLLASILGID